MKRYGIVLLLLATSSGFAVEPYLLYVSNERSNDVSVIDPVTRTTVRTIAAGRRPRGIHVGPVTGRIYVAVSGSPRMGPGADPDRAKHQVVDKSADGIAVIDPSTARVTRVLRVGSDPEQFAIDRDERRLVVANEDEAQASVWEIATGDRLAVFPIAEEPEGVALHPTRDEAYVTCEASGQVFILDLTTRAELARIEVGGRPRSVAFTTDGSRAFVPSEGETSIQVIDTRAHRKVGAIPVTGGPGLPMAAVVTPDNRFVLVSTGRGNAVAVLEIASETTVALIPVGGRPWGLVLSPDGRTAYAANGTTDDLSVIDVATRRQVARIKAGAGPWGVAVAPQRSVSPPNPE